jgi:molybdopterin molybdotransferase
MKNLISFGAASHLINKEGVKKQNAFLQNCETLKIERAVGRICTTPIYSREAVPPFNNSSMDGFAVKANETQTQKTFRVLGRISAGDIPFSPSEKEVGGCYEIMTGAPVPEGYDAIYKIEDVDILYDLQEKPLTIIVKDSIEKFTHFRAVGVDFPMGKKLFDRGIYIMPEHIMALASVGVSQIQVLKKPRIAILSTGSELTDLDLELQPGKIRNSTTSYLLSSLELFGAEIFCYGTVSDDRDHFVSAIEDILKKKPDIILTTGAVSMGVHDFIPIVIQEMGAEIIFHKTAIKPGKPILFAKFNKGGPAFFGIPGNPISTVVGLRFFVNAYIRALTGKKVEQELRGKLKNEEEKPLGLRCFYKARVDFTDSGPQITSLSGQPSFMISSLLQANAWVVFHEDQGRVTKGSDVGFYPLYPFDYEYSERERGLGNDSNYENDSSETLWQSP